MPSDVDIHQVVSAVDNGGILPLSYACFFGCDEAVKLLLAAESPLSSASRHYSVLDDASASRNVPSFTLVATALAQRRKRLLRTAWGILPSHIWGQINRSEQGIPDSNLTQIIQALQSSVIPIDAHYVCVRS